jgi:membrane protein implicated in regulation of membrane protease activity
MGSVYLYSAAIGGTILVLQTILLFAAGHSGGDLHSDVPDVTHDAALDHAADAQNAFLKILSLKAIVAFMTFFGLAGLATTHAGTSSATALLTALAAGLASVFLVAHLMAALSRLQSQGNVDLRNAVGTHAQVYLRIPANHTGAGRILVPLQGRRIECRAVTAGPEIPTGHEVRVTHLADPGTLEVEAVTP